MVVGTCVFESEKKKGCPYVEQTFISSHNTIPILKMSDFSVAIPPLKTSGEQ
jgi:hypothetical protein